MIPFSLEKPKSAGEPADLFIFGDICEGPWLFDGEASPYSLVSSLKDLDTSDLSVHIDSYGGDTSAGIAIYNVLQNCGLNVTTIAEGFACSAASLIFMAGKSRVMRKSSLLMIHNAWTAAVGNADDLRKTAEDLDKISATAAKIYENDSTLSAEEIKTLLDNETWITPEEAVEYGFATAIDEDRTDSKSHSSAFKAIYQSIVAEKQDLTTAYANGIPVMTIDNTTGKLVEPPVDLRAEPVENSQKPAEPEHEPVKTPFQRFFGNLH